MDSPPLVPRRHREDQYHAAAMCAVAFVTFDQHGFHLAELACGSNGVFGCATPCVDDHAAPSHWPCLACPPVWLDDVPAGLCPGCGYAANACVCTPLRRESLAREVARAVERRAELARHREHRDYHHDCHPCIEARRRQATRACPFCLRRPCECPASARRVNSDPLLSGEFTPDELARFQDARQGALSL